MIILYAINDNGNGFVSQIGKYEDIKDIEIRIGMFAPDVVIKLETEK